MPTYEYKCKSCSRHFEFFQRITDQPKKMCPVCNTETLKRLLGTGAGVLFKGSGFYQTDYRSSSYKKAAEKEKPAAAQKSPDSSKKEAPKKETK